jgi:hypothetical protein
MVFAMRYSSLLEAICCGPSRASPTKRLQSCCATLTPAGSIRRSQPGVSNRKYTQFVTATVSIAVCAVLLEPLPTDAVMVILSVPIGVPVFDEFPTPTLPLPPQPNTGLRQIITASKSIAMYFQMRLRLVLGNTNRSNAAMTTPLAPFHDRGPPVFSCSIELVGAVVVIVNCEVAAALPLGVTLVGENTQAAPDGSPEHAN